MIKKLFALMTVVVLLLPAISLAADDGVPRITKEELKEKMDKGEGIVILDVRTGGSYDGNKVKIKGAIRIAPNEVEARLKEIPQDKEIITYCT